MPTPRDDVRTEEEGERRRARRAVASWTFERRPRLRRSGRGGDFNQGRAGPVPVVVRRPGANPHEAGPRPPRHLLRAARGPRVPPLLEMKDELGPRRRRPPPSLPQLYSSLLFTSEILLLLCECFFTCLNSPPRSLGWRCWQRSAAGTSFESPPLPPPCLPVERQRGRCTRIGC